MAACSVTVLYEQACASGFVGVAQNPVTARALGLQLLCNIAEDTTDLRITEDGDVRITMDGDVRIVSL